MEKKFSERLTSIEKKWQKTWESENVYRTERESGKKYYVLEMFPYPSGNLHMGHVRNFSLGDAPARMKRMQGYDVMHPIGWDAFGLPAENAAIERDLDPEDWTRDCINQMKSQLKRLGFSYDWDREIATCNPEYYKWNQWIFLKMMKEGLAYKDDSNVNWCPDCETVLADEQVEDGSCWRCETEVIQKEMSQWFLKITNYSEELLQDLDQLEEWPNKVVKMQEQWIGKSEGATISFPIKDKEREIEVFTTRPDTIHGTTFMALAPEHEHAQRIADHNQEVKNYCEKAAKKDPDNRADNSKSGVFSGEYAVNPVTGEEIPIYIAEYVLTDYGTGAIMAVPAHDQRDFEFAKEHNIEIKEVVKPSENHAYDEDGAYEGNGEHVNSEYLNGLENEEAIQESIEKISEDEVGKQDVSYQLRDWLISRQRYWGTPIPVVNCEECGPVPVPEDNLPIELPKDVEFKESGNPIETSDTWVETTCPDCGSDAERETDTMDTFIGSSWYFLRYVSPDLDSAPFSQEDSSYWMNVDQYIGGIEHAVMHLLYARFFQKFLRDQGMVEEDEPFERLLTLGMVNHPAYECPQHGWMYPDQVDEDGACEKCGEEVEVTVRKMSKSKHNVVDPTELVENHGADTARVFILRSAGPTKELEWSDEGVASAEQMLENIYKLVDRYKDSAESVKLSEHKSRLEDRIVASKIQRSIQSVTEETENYRFNIALDEIDNLLTKLNWYGQNNPDLDIMSNGIRVLTKLISPYAPHLSEELWSMIGEGELIVGSDWPEPDAGLIDEDAEKIDDYYSSVSSDIREIIEVTESDPDQIKLVRSAEWKYRSAKKIRDKLEDTKDVGEIMGTVLDEDLKPKADTVKKQAVKAVENPVKYSQNFVSKEIEDEALELNRSRIEEEFGCEVVTEQEEQSEEERKERARPGKPAIVLY